MRRACEAVQREPNTPTFSPTENPWAGMNILKTTAHFLAVAGRATPIIRQDLAPKHQHMTKAVFPFLPVTFYRWPQLWPEVCTHLAIARRYRV